MTKITKKSMIVLALSIITLLAISNFYIQKQTQNSESLLQEYQVRKENLTSTQEQLRSLLVELNNTLQQEVVKQNNLSGQLDQLKSQKIKITAQGVSGSSGSSSSSSSSGSSSSRTTTTTTQPPAPTPAPQASSPPPQPSPTPTPRTTRAS